jgi:hypothetical protein
LKNGFDFCLDTIANTWLKRTHVYIVSDPLHLNTKMNLDPKKGAPLNDYAFHFLLLQLVQAQDYVSGLENSILVVLETKIED